MSMCVKTDIIFGVKCFVELTKDDIEKLKTDGVESSPCTYRADDETEEYVIGILIKDLSHVNQTKEVNFSSINQDEYKAKIIKALNDLEIDVPEHKKFATYVNSYYY